ncbi:MAG: dihydrolipoyl dehydrogenase [Gammaproteobacteria bacterium]|nr:dihydrolipoyl dehydrogenase [Gammaproteobacteria bacterium]
MNKKFITALLTLFLIFLFFYFDLHQQINLVWLKARQDEFLNFYLDHPIITIAIYMVVYIALSFSPVAAVLTLAGGALFGLLLGTVVVSFASTIGATVALLLSRYLFHDTIQTRFADQLRTFNKGIEREGAFYLFALRLVPIFPFFAINLMMGLTRMRVWTFFWVSQIGMFPGTIVYVLAGTQLAEISSLKGIFTPGLIGAFALLGAFPIIAKNILTWMNTRKVYSACKKPKKFNRNLVVIGAGSAGLVSAYIAAAVKAKVSLIEKHKMGGDCLNTGCVPSKALLRSAKYLSHIQRAEEFGFKNAKAEFDFEKIMQRVHNTIKKIEPHDSIERYTELGVDCIQGEAKIVSPYEVAVNGKILTTRNIIIAAGARPFVPPIPGLEKIAYLTSDNLWNLTEQPKRLAVLGGGPIGCELAQAFARLGSEVTQVEMLPRLLAREDPEISEWVQKRFTDEGIRVLVKHKAKSFHSDGQTFLICENMDSGKNETVEFDQVLVAVGRAANNKGLGLEELGIPLNQNGTVTVNEYLQTKFPNIYACGDVAGPYQFTHTASHQAWYCVVNALFGHIKKFKVDYSTIPRATFTEPEIARVGLNETEAKEKYVAYEVTTYAIDDLDRAIADSEAHGMVKVLTVPGKDKILGVTIVGEHAGDLIAEYILAMKHGLGLNKILGTIHIYPTLAEANKYAAGQWKRAHAPDHILSWLARYHRWLR